MGWPRDPLLDTDVDHGRYRVIRRIGSGGFGVVYQVHHTVLGTDRAMKVLAAHLASDPSITNAFIAEARLLHGLDHPHIVRCYDIGQLAATGQPFMLMELLRGRDLATVVAPPHDVVAPLSARRVAHMGLQLASALVAAHRHGEGLLHRDIKPPNVFLLDEPASGLEDHVKLIDFGIAKVLGNATGQRRTLRVIGTPDYMAPEQFMPGHLLDARLDIWQLGAVLFFALVGRPPYMLAREQVSMDPLALYRLQMAPARRNMGPRPSELLPRFQQAHLDELIGRMLASDPNARPDSAADLVAAFRTLLGDPEAFAPEELEEVTHRPTLEVPANPWSETMDLTSVPAANSSTTTPAAPPSTPSQGPAPMIGQRARVGAFSAAVPLRQGSRQTRAHAGSPPDEPAPNLGSARDLSATGRFSERGRTSLRVQPLLHVELIWPGHFEMGSPWDEPGRSNDEAQFEAIITHPFLIANSPVTWHQWAEVMGLEVGPHDMAGYDHPVTGVSWFDAIAFANALSLLEGRRPSYELHGVHGHPGVDLTMEHVEFVGIDSPGYRLPTEAEWEYACRAGVTRSRYGPLDAVAWFSENSGGVTHAVGQKIPNAWGLYDVLGQVWEWVYDWYGPYPDIEVHDPMGSEFGYRRVVRGGSFNSFGQDVRAATRHSAEPTLTSVDLGFRLVRTMGSAP